MQPGRSFEQLGVIAKYGGERAGLRGHTLDMRPATGQRDFEQLACEFFGPVSLVHAIKVTECAGGRARTRRAIWGRPLSLRRLAKRAVKDLPSRRLSDTRGKR